VSTANSVCDVWFTDYYSCGLWIPGQSCEWSCHNWCRHNSWNDRSVFLQSWLFAHGSTCIAIVYHQWAVEWNSTYMWTYVLHDDSIWVTIYIACKVICCLLLFSPIRLSPLFTSLSLPFPNLPLFLLKQLTVVPYRIHWTVW